MKAEFQIRKMTVEDVDAVHEVDKKCFTAPWTKKIFEKEVSSNSFAHYFVVEHEETIIGYLGMWIVIDDAQITNIAILPDYRGHGIGENVFGYGMAYAQKTGATRLSLEVRVTNEVAQSLYKKFGLKKGGVRKGYYPDNCEDAYVMWVNL